MPCPHARTIILKMLCDYWEHVGDEEPPTIAQGDAITVGQILGDYCLDCNRLVNAWVEDEDEMETRAPLHSPSPSPSPIADRLAEALRKILPDMRHLLRRKYGDAFNTESELKPYRDLLAEYEASKGEKT